MFTRFQRSFLLIGPIAMVAACSQPANTLLPSAPSAVTVDAAASAGFGGWTTQSTASAIENALSAAAAAGKKNVSGVGTVANLRGSCATDAEQHVSFTVQGVKVVTDATTEFFIDAQETAIEGGCGNLRNGTKVRVVADETQNADASFTAQKVTIVDQPGGRPPVSVAGEGVVGARKGECPSLTMVVHGYPVMTTSFTTFEGDCEAIVPGTRIKVEGVLGGNSVVADSVEIVAPATTP